MSSNLPSIHGIQLNCQSINSKTYEIRALLDSLNPHFCAFSETWITHHAPKFRDYHCYWKNRVGSLGGGLGLLIKSGLSHLDFPLAEYSGGVLEIHAIKIFTSLNQAIVIVNLYKPPRETLIFAEIKHYVDQLGSSYIITGDFNAHSLIFDDSIINADSSGKNIENLLLKEDLCSINPLNFYTRIQYTADQVSKSYNHLRSI